MSSKIEKAFGILFPTSPQFNQCKCLTLTLYRLKCMQSFAKNISVIVSTVDSTTLFMTCTVNWVSQIARPCQSPLQHQMQQLHCYSCLACHNSYTIVCATLSTWKSQIRSSSFGIQQSASKRPKSRYKLCGLNVFIWKFNFDFAKLWNITQVRKQSGCCPGCIWQSLRLKEQWVYALIMTCSLQQETTCRFSACRK